MEKKLPKRWVETKLGVVAEWGSGGTPNRSEPNYYNGTIPWIKTGDLNDSIIFEASEYITELGVKKSSAKLFPKGSIIVAMYGATIGKTAKLGIDATTNQACAVAQAYKIVIPEFLHYFLKAEKQEFIDKGKGGAQPNISQTVIKEHPFPLPPLPEQQRIVAKLDTLFGHLDALKTRLDRIPQLLKDFRQKVLTQAVTGKLTEEWREERELEEWEMKTLGEFVIKIQAGKNFNCPAYPVTENTVGLVKISAVTWGKFDPNETKTVLDENKIFPELFIKKGDFLMSRANTLELVGASLIVDEIKFRIMLSDKIWRVTFKEEIDKRYVDFFLKSSIGRNEIESRATGNQLSMRNISHDSFKKIDFNYPPFEEQQEIVCRVESLFAKADQIEASYQKLKTKIEQLPQALLAKAFRGELVAQLPSDGDARDLLAQIKMAKAGLEKGGKGRKMKVEDEVNIAAEPRGRYGNKQKKMSDN